MRAILRIMSTHSFLKLKNCTRRALDRACFFPSRIIRRYVLLLRIIRADLARARLASD
jgi:hypothetical protein